ncbi:MAG: hypothetical protein NTW87_08695 [Planctomycetota bacterium]|nr:hypothetical protein [Planctomycetota bacterium]
MSFEPRNQYAFRPSYQRALPHIQPPGATLFVTFRLAGSIPQALLTQWLAEQHRAVAAAARGRDEREKAQGVSKARRALFARLEGRLDSAVSGPRWLKDARVAALVAEGLRYRDGKVYDLEAYCVMPNHVHVVFTPRPITSHNLAKCATGVRPADAQYCSLSSIMHSLKLYTAIRGNRLLGRSGQFWEHESYDHVVRDENELGRIIRYVLSNPVKAGLAARWQDWLSSYSRYGAAE